MSKCVFMQDMLISRCNFITHLEYTYSKKRLAGRSFFQNSGTQGPERVSPDGRSRILPLGLFFHIFLRLSRALIMQLNYHKKASIKVMAFYRKNKIIPWQGVYFFTNTVLQNLKLQKHTVVMKTMINTIGKKIHTLVKKTHHAIIK